MLLDRLGMTKSEFARRMEIQRQNVNVWFKTNNLEIISRAARVLEMPLQLLVSYVDEPDIYDIPDVYVDESVVDGEADEIRPEDVPVGVRRRTHEKVQYCITELKIEKDASRASL